MRDADGRYPPIEPFETGMLDVGDENLVYWERCGNPQGEPVLVVHGGPGSGCSTNQRRAFDPERCQIVLFDQRGCGRSTPHASDPATRMECNTTHHLVADMERLRRHLGIERWLLFGGSWGSALALAYAVRFPERVRQIVLVDVTTGSRSEYDWLYRGVGMFFPEAWERFRAGARDSDILAGYARLMDSEDPDVRDQAARDWCAWEDAVLSLEPHGSPNPYGDRPDAARLAFVRICAHYAAHAAWLEDDPPWHRLAGIPGTLIHGRLDMSAPARTAWDLAQAWPEATLHLVEDAGHKGSPTMQALLNEALDMRA
ncbi:MAG: prolyl aminopeptidase [Chthonomonadaceae bacterium]|nr:prolyl aminopeptidase [Chthonomonadaceae bacterium]